jgi:short-subunit dehydrogenase
MREQRSGRILFISSTVGFHPAPFMGFYAASKHAIEGYSESLDHEIRTLGVRALLIEPGFIKTRIDQNSAQARSTISDYAADRQRAAAWVNTSVQRGDDPSLVARTVLSALAAKRPRLRYTVGRTAGMLTKLRTFLPAPLFDRSLRQFIQLS